MNELRTEPPRGMALYVRKLSKHRHKSPHKFSRLCANYRLRWIALATIWHDKNGSRVINPIPVVAEYSQALAEVGINPHIWGYPWHDRIDRFVDLMGQYTNPYVSGILLDPELGLKGYPEEAKKLFEGIRKINPYLLAGLTSYGLPDLHRAFPFSSFAEEGGRGDILVECDYGSPQLYAMSHKRVVEGVTGYHRLGFDFVVPSFGAYKFVKSETGKKRAVSYTPDELETHLNHFVGTGIKIPGMIGWAENFMTRGLWDVLGRWAEKFDREKFI